jgi:hypothetical protein
MMPRSFSFGNICFKFSLQCMQVFFTLRSEWSCKQYRLEDRDLTKQTNFFGILQCIVRGRASEGRSLLKCQSLFLNLQCVGWRKEANAFGAYR